MSLSLITRSDLMGRLVIDQQSVEELGHVHQIFVDSKSHKIVGVSCKSGLLGRNMRDFKWADISSIGEDSVLINWNKEATSKRPDSVNSMVGLEL